MQNAFNQAYRRCQSSERRFLVPAQLIIPHAAAILALADGTVFRGISVGCAGQAVGEAVFNTSLTGYQEILTDPSYCRQLVTLTYPHIGNTGANEEDTESSRIHAAGLIVKDVPARASNFRLAEALSAYLKRHQTVGIAQIDTRRLTRVLRTSGAQNACIVALKEGEAISEAHVQLAQTQAQQAPQMAGTDLARVVSTTKSYEWNETEWQLDAGHGRLTTDLARYHVVAFDFGIKHNILRKLASRGCRVTVVPAQTSAQAVLALDPQGIFLSNGPGDPEPCTYAIEATRTLLERGIPIFGICLGHQILALASGAQTFKMKFGHHGANHPVKDLKSGRVSITSQNHGFAVKAETLPAHLKATHISLFDNSIQGLERTDRPAFSFQGHPEASPGPHDVDGLFDRFISLMSETTRL
jgi:carbamoyl-phosphate synthase small subunit